MQKFGVLGYTHILGLLLHLVKFPSEIPDQFILLSSEFWFLLTIVNCGIVI